MFRILAADLDASRLKLAQAMGADVVIDTSKQDLNQVKQSMLRFVSP